MGILGNVLVPLARLKGNVKTLLGKSILSLNVLITAIPVTVDAEFYQNKPLENDFRLDSNIPGRFDKMMMREPGNLPGKPLFFCAGDIEMTFTFCDKALRS